MKDFEKYKNIVIAFLQEKCYPKHFIRIKSQNTDKIYNILYNPERTEKFEVRISQVGKIPDNNGKLTTNTTKNKLINGIASKLKYKVINNGKIYLLVKGYAIKIELIKTNKYFY